MEKIPKAEVSINDSLERIFISPLKGFDRNVIRIALKGALGNIPMSSTAEGITILPEFAHRLLQINGEVELRWVGDARLFVENRERINSTIREIKRGVEEIKTNGVDYADKLIRDIEGIGSLDEHQRVNVAAMTLTDSPGLCIFDEQGTGKTVTVIYAYDLLVQRDKIDIALIFAPKSMVPEWETDFRRFKGDLYRYKLISGDRGQKRQALYSDSDVFITNYETAISMRDDLITFLRLHRGRVALVIDESFYIKNLDAKRTRALRRLREHCKVAYVLCGTPAPNSPRDLIQQFNMVDFGYTFQNTAITDDDQENHGVVQNLMGERGLYIRHLKGDVLPDIPEKRFNRLILPIVGQQRELYIRVLRDLVEELEAVNEEAFRRRIGSFLAKRLTLLQICSNPLNITQSYEESPAKHRALDELLNELINNRGEKVVLWSFFRRSIDSLLERYSVYKPIRYDGTITDTSTRRESVARFQEDNSSMLFIANPAAAGAGLTLHRSRFAIYESMSNQAAHYLQSIDRIHRRGQTRDAEYFILLCQDTIELNEYERLIKKELTAQQLLGDMVPEQINREVMLQEALESLGRMNY